MAKTRVIRPGLPPEAGNGIIAPQAQHSLTGCSAFANQGLIMTFHPHFQGVIMYQPEDVDITYKGAPVVTGYREKRGHKFWRVLIEAPQDNSPRNCRQWIDFYSQNRHQYCVNKCQRQRKQRTMCTRYRRSPKASNGCTLYADTQPNQHESRQLGRETLMGGHC